MNEPGADRLPPGQQLIADDRWPVVGERAPRADASPWTVRVAGLVSEAREWTLDDLCAMPQVERILDIHCVTRWSKFAMRFRGVPLEAILPRSALQPDARYVSFVARSTRRHSTSLSVDQLFAADPLVALSADGMPLTVEHGGPVRVVVPGRYFYKSLKWLEQIECLSADRLGYWEADAGYHNQADPWREQRYVAPHISKQQAARLMATRDFSQLDLLSIDLAEHELNGLVAKHALLRNANFRNAQLRRAIFDHANLSNAHFDHADLREASFLAADVEGANFAGADLRGADLRVASMFGASFCEIDEHGQPFQPARLDASTQLDESLIGALTTAQQSFLLGLKNFFG